MKPIYSSTNKHLSRDEIIKLVKNQLQTDVASKAMQHLQTCEFCNEAYEGIKQLPDISTLQTLNSQWKAKTRIKKHSPNLEINPQSFYTVLLLIGLLGLIIIYFFFFRELGK